MRISEKCRNNNIKKYNNSSDNPLTSRRTNGGKKDKKLKTEDAEMKKNVITLLVISIGNFI